MTPGVISVDGQGAQRYHQHHAIERRSRQNRPTLRDHIGPAESRERREHPEEEKYQQDTRTALTRTEHQTDRAHGASQQHDQGCRAQTAKRLSGQLRHLSFSITLGRPPISTVHDWQTRAPRANRFTVLLRHHTGGLRQVSQVVRDPRGQQPTQRDRPKLRMLAFEAELRISQMPDAERGQALSSKARKRVEQIGIWLESCLATVPNEPRAVVSRRASAPFACWAAH